MVSANLKFASIFNQAVLIDESRFAVVNVTSSILAATDSIGRITNLTASPAIVDGRCKINALTTTLGASPAVVSNLFALKNTLKTLSRTVLGPKAAGAAPF